MKPVKIYSTPTCHFCHLAKEYFKEHNVQFEEVNVAGDPVMAREMIELSGQRGVPVILIGDDFVVGFDQERIDSLLEIG